MKRPVQGEYPDFYDTYIKLVPEGNIQNILAEQQKAIEDFIPTIPDSKVDFRYAPGKWSLKEVFGHMIDTERIMSYKLLRIARGDKTPLAGFEVNAYVENAYYDQRNLANLLEEYVSVRRATLSLINGLAEEASERVGVTNDNLVTARSIPFIIAGHELHHWSIIKERYMAY